jgi:hypothetical protein
MFTILLHGGATLAASAAPPLQVSSQYEQVSDIF